MEAYVFSGYEISRIGYPALRAPPNPFEDQKEEQKTDLPSSLLVFRWQWNQETHPGEVVAEAIPFSMAESTLEIRCT